MFKDIVKATIVCGFLSSALGACSAGAGGANIAPAVSPVTAAAAVEHSDASHVGTAAVESSPCVAGFTCTNVTIVAALRGANDGLGLLLFSSATSSEAWIVTQAKLYSITRQTVATGTLCEAGCSLVVSGVPLSSGSATASIVEPTLSQSSRTSVTLAELSSSWPTGTYYFYLADRV